MIVKSATYYYFMLWGLTLTLTELEAEKHLCWRRVATSWETRTSHWYPSSNWYQAEKTKTSGEWWNTRWWSCRNGEEHGTVYTSRTITTKVTGTSVSKFIPGRQDMPKANELWFAFSSDGRWENEIILYALARANEWKNEILYALWRLRLESNASRKSDLFPSKEIPLSLKNRGLNYMPMHFWKENWTPSGLSRAIWIANEIAGVSPELEVRLEKPNWNLSWNRDWFLEKVKLKNFWLLPWFSFTYRSFLSNFNPSSHFDHHALMKTQAFFEQKCSGSLRLKIVFTLFEHLYTKTKIILCSQK